MPKIKYSNKETFINDYTFKVIVSQSPVSTQIFNLKGETIFVNKAWIDLWQINPEEISKYNILKDKQLIKKGIMPYIKKGFKGEVTQIPAIKYEPAETLDFKEAVKYRWVKAIIYPIKDKSGNIIEIVIQHDDITEQKTVEEELQRQRLQFEAIAELGQLALSGVSKEIVFNTAVEKLNKVLNNNFSKILQLDENKDKLILRAGKGWNKTVKVDKYKLSADPNTQAGYTLKIKQPVIFKNLNAEDRFKGPSLLKKHKVVSGMSVLIWNINKPWGILSTHSKSYKEFTEHDIDFLQSIANILSMMIERKISENQLLQNEERLRTAVDAGNIGVWDWNILEDKLNWSKNVFSMYGIDDPSFKMNSKNHLKFIFEADRENFMSKLQISLKYKLPFSIDFRCKRLDGEIIWLTTRGTVYYDEKDNPIRMIGSTSDITQRKQLEQDKNDFLSMASHELKTPLTSMKMFIELLDKQLRQTDLEKPKYFVSRIKDQADRLSSLTNDLLDVSRIETGKLRLNKEPFQIGNLLFETVDSILPSINSHKIILSKLSKANVLADKYRIYQVILNLLTNAVKYSPNSKEIIVSSEIKNKEVIVSVKDQGIGIKKSELEKVFNKLYQVGERNEKTYPGLGLGLYISKEIIERHKGKIWVESKRGVGSTFYFTLPLAK